MGVAPSLAGCRLARTCIMRRSWSLGLWRKVGSCSSSNIQSNMFMFMGGGPCKDHVQSDIGGRHAKWSMAVSSVSNR